MSQVPEKRPEAQPEPAAESQAQQQSQRPQGPAPATMSLSFNSMAYQGPVPVHVFMGEMERLHPGYISKHLKAMEEETFYRRARDMKLIDERIRSQRQGQAMGFIIALAGLAFATAMAWVGAQTAAAVVGGTTVLGLTRTFVNRSRKPPWWAEAWAARKQAKQEKAKPTGA